MKGEIFKPYNELETQFQQEKTMNMLFQEFRREGWTDTAIIVCKLNKSL